jgi:hypothetical protein
MKCPFIQAKKFIIDNGYTTETIQGDCMKSECAMWINCAEKESEGCAFHFMGLAAADKWFSQFREEEG